MKQIILKMMSFALTLFLCGIILLQNFQIATRIKKSSFKGNSITENSANMLSSLTCEPNNEASWVFWIKNNFKICISNSFHGQSETEEEEETKLLETDELCNDHSPFSIVLITKEIVLSKIDTGELPNPYLLRTSPPPEIN